MVNSLKWRFGALTFIILAMTFAYLNNKLEYIFDATGLTGKSTELELDKPVDKPEGNGKPQSRQQKQKADPLGYVPVTGSFRGGYLCVKRKQPIKLDGDASDWELRAGQFICLDCEKKSGSESAWAHLMYDDEGLYVFGRVRNSSKLSGPEEYNSDLKKANFLQVSLVTDLATAINIWRTSDGKPMVQLHYYLPKRYPREIKAKDDSLFTAEDAIHREDGLKKGAVAGLVLHGDNNGVDIECMIPWSALCRDVANKPADGQTLECGIGTKFGEKTMGVLQLTTDRHNKGMRSVWMVDAAPEKPLPIEVKFNNRGNSKIYPVVLDKAAAQLRVEWSNPMDAGCPINPLLPITPAKEITIDAQADEWPTTSEITITENYFGRFGSTLLRAAADDAFLYLYALVGDPTPDAGGDMVKIWMKTDKIHELLLNLEGLEVDGKDALKSGAELKSSLGEGYENYSLEAKIPWKLLTASGSKPGDFPITCRVFLNPVWNVQGLVTVLSGDDEPGVKTWATAKMMEAPEVPMPVHMISGDVIDLSAGKNIRIGKGGVSLRNPYAVHNPALNALPGKATVDGSLDEWDLSGGIFLCDDVSIFSNIQAAWIHAMYDETNLYLLYRFNDSTPMANTSTNIILNDMAEFYFVKDSQFILGQAHVTSKDKSSVQTSVKGDRAKKESKDIISSITTVFKLNEDGKGYVQEVAIPLKWLTKATPLNAGDSAQVYFSVRTSPQMLLGGPEKAGCYKNVAKNKEFYGTMIFKESGKMALEPLRLLNGSRLPVTMVDGKPTVDLSALSR